MLGDLAVMALGNEWRREEDGKKRRKRNWICGRVISGHRDFMLSDCTPLSGNMSRNVACMK